MLVVTINSYSINNDNPSVNSNIIVFEGYGSGVQPIPLITPTSLGVFDNEYVHLNELIYLFHLASNGAVLFLAASLLPLINALCWNARRCFLNAMLS